MRGLFEIWRPMEDNAPTHRAARERAGIASARISHALIAAELANVDYLQAAGFKATTEGKLTEARQRSTNASAKISALAHLRECAALAIEMRKGLADALGSWVLSECTAGTGLSQRELETLLEVIGAAQK